MSYTSHGTLTVVTNDVREQFTADPTNTNQGGGIIVTRTCDWDDRDSNTPSLLSAYAGGSPYLLVNVDRRKLPNNLAQIVLTYNATVNAVPDSSYVEQSNQIEVDIREHPHFNDWADDWDNEAEAFVPGSSKYGIKSYIKGSTTVTRTDYFNSKPASAKGDIGKLESPGTGYGSSANWLLVGANRAKQGNFWVMQKTYLYSAVAYNSDIYSS